MKVTNFELSKKLSEIGFKADSHLFYTKRKELWWNEKHGLNPEKEPEFLCYAYDLETILEALPKNIIADGSSDGADLEISFEYQEIGYQYDGAVTYFEDGNTEIKIDFSENEPLVDTAAHLLILLFEKGLIKFE